MFCSSPSVIPTHTPGTDGPSRATHLCVSLVAHSASYFSVDADTIKIHFDRLAYRVSEACGGARGPCLQPKLSDECHPLPCRRLVFAAVERHGNEVLVIIHPS